LLKVPYHWLYVFVLAFACVGVFTMGSSSFQLYALVFFGVLGYVLKAAGLSPALFILGFILGPMFEENFRRAMSISRGSLMTFVERPISLTFVLLGLGVVALTETLYQDLRLVTDQVHCSLLCPYFVPTGIADSERNRPADMSNATLTGSQKVARAMSQKAVGSGKVTATHIAEKVFAAMAEEQFYIFSHPHALGNVQARMEDILQLRNPTDAFAGRPEVGQQLREALRAAAAAA